MVPGGGRNKDWLTTYITQPRQVYYGPGVSSISLKRCPYLRMNNAKRANFPSFINDVGLSTSKKLRILQDI